MNQLKVDIYSLLRSLPPLLPSHPFRLSQSTELSSRCHTAAFHEPPILHMTVYICQCYSLCIYVCRDCVYMSVHPTLSFLLLSPQVCSLCLHLYSCPAHRFINTIFLDSLSLSLYIYIYIYIFSSVQPLSRV